MTVLQSNNKGRSEVDSGGGHFLSCHLVFCALIVYALEDVKKKVDANTDTRV